MATGSTAETPAAKIALSASPSRARMSPPVIMKAVVTAARNDRPYEASIALVLLSIVSPKCRWVNNNLWFYDPR